MPETGSHDFGPDFHVMHNAPPQKRELQRCYSITTCRYLSHRYLSGTEYHRAAEWTKEAIGRIPFLKNVLIGLTQQTDKLVFVGLCPKLPVIANQRARWCGIPPVRREMYRNVPKKVKIIAILVVIVTRFHGAGGLPRQCEHWLAMTAYIWCALSNTNLPNSLLRHFRWG